MAAGLIVLGLPGHASAQELAASCPGPRESDLGGAPSQARWGQTFMPTIAGELSTAEIAVGNFATVPGDYRIDINAVDGTGIPTNDILASTTIPNAAVPDGQSTVTASFVHPAQVAVGQQYALVITQPAPASDNLQVGIRFGDDCAGQLFLSDSQTASFSAQALAGEDLVFNVFVTPAPPTPAEDQAPPDTTITKHPKDKTKKKPATFEFTGTDARAIASFECSLDGDAFATCISPYTVKVKKGKHTFQVRAIDQAGNVGTPAPTTGSEEEEEVTGRC